MTGTDGVRVAVVDDAAAVKAVTDMAYRHYIPRIGVVPQPMEADHMANVVAGRVFVTGEPVTGLVVIEERGDHLFLDSIAVHPDAHGTGWDGGCWSSWTHARVPSAWARSGSTRTR